MFGKRGGIGGDSDLSKTLAPKPAKGSEQGARPDVAPAPKPSPADSGASGSGMARYDPAPKMTTRPFSRWRCARSGM